MNVDSLTVMLWGQVIGTVRRGQGGRLTFTYDAPWRTSSGASPLSLSMPLAAAEHAHDRIDAFLWNLLPDSQRVLDAWGRRFHVSSRNAFSLIAEVGEDCAGAVQLVRPERVDALLEAGPPSIEWLDEAGVAERLAALRRDHSAWLPSRDTGQFSLAGAQPKTAFAFDDGRWGVPQGRTPTTHILKPPTSEFEGMVENEHLCLTLAREVGLPAASSEVMRFGDEVAIVIERFDRARTALLAAAAAAEAAAAAAAVSEDSDATGAAHAAARAAKAAARAASLGALAKEQPVLRLHQEDLCQALGLPPTSKYQNEGGPSPERVVDLLRTHSTRAEEDVATFVDALAFNWLVAGTDGHAKNFSLLHGRAGRVRLAPLYDIASALPYAELDPYRIKLAMKVGGKYRIRDIGPAEWTKLARGLRLDEEATVERIASLATTLLETVEHVFEEATRRGLDDAIVHQLEGAIVKRAAQCLARLRP